MPLRAGGGDDALDGADYVSGTSIQWKKLIGTIVGAFWVLTGTVFAAFTDTAAGLYVWYLNELGAGASGFISFFLGESAAIQAQAWATALASAAKFEVVAPIMMVLTAVATIWVVAEILEASPIDE